MEERTGNWVKVFDAATAQQEAVAASKKPLLLKIGGLKICLAFSEDSWKAVADECPHLGESLSKGTLNSMGEVICPWHSYRYHLTTGIECRNRTSEVRIFPVKLNEGGLFILIS